jgi:alcohol dehydrogenase class IV
LDFQLPSLPVSVKKDLQKTLNSKNPALKLKTLAKKMGAKTTLKAIGFKEADIPKATEMVLALNKFANPVELTLQNVHDLLLRCYIGRL